jgi:hypothetical protein
LLLVDASLVAYNGVCYLTGFNPHPALRTRHCCRVMLGLTRAAYTSIEFQSAPGTAAG